MKVSAASARRELSRLTYTAHRQTVRVLRHLQLTHQLANTWKVGLNGGACDHHKVSCNTLLVNCAPNS